MSDFVCLGDTVVRRLDDDKTVDNATCIDGLNLKTFYDLAKHVFHTLKISLDDTTYGPVYGTVDEVKEVMSVPEKGILIYVISEHTYFREISSLLPDHLLDEGAFVLL
ncbi:hypothetical protein NDU88_004487 [Pleurodeles waltl]|uniref:Uncharacterized protein n=1 Tax=Pleurodeles waltl TaxID=8319 RepID=A0AAV7UF69_PLEWA|nr:hypothetical protein NDU88_004487 [Pleurodeles waltl]